MKQNGLSGNLLYLLTNFLRNRKQRVVLNRQIYSWADVNAGVSQGSILGPIFDIYINDLVDGLSSNAKLFADDTSLFSVVHNANTAAKEFSNDIVGKKKNTILLWLLTTMMYRKMIHKSI